MDYYTQLRGQKFVNPLLYNDLEQVMGTDLEVFCFASIDEGIRDFVKRTRVKAEKLPTLVESKEIKEGLDSLLPLGWLDTSMDDAYGLRLWAQSRQRMLSPALRAGLLYSSGNHSWISRYLAAAEAKPPKPDKTG